MQQHQIFQIFTQELSERFYKALESKTGWGKNDVWKVFQQAFTEAQAVALDHATRVNDPNQPQ